MNKNRENQSDKNISQDVQNEEENMMELPETKEKEQEEEGVSLNETVEKYKKELSEYNDKYVRIYAEFENYKRRVSREKEEIIKYANEELLGNLLPVIDHLELALRHAANSKETTASALAEGVEMTLREMRSTLEKFGVVEIEAIGKPFDPYIHHAMSQIETEESDESTVVTEFRKGYMLGGRVLRPAYVGVSKKPSRDSDKERPERNEKQNTEEAEEE